MITLSKRCIACNVKHRAFGVEGSRPTHCAACAEPFMIDIYQSCSVDNCRTRIYKRARESQMCMVHFVDAFPDTILTRRILFKERALLQAIKTQFPDLDVVHNRTIGCSKKRPDVLIDLGSLVLIVEIDEEWHDSYDPKCEAARLTEITAEIARPVYLIHFNPHEMQFWGVRLFYPTDASIRTEFALPAQK